MKEYEIKARQIIAMHQLQSDALMFEQAKHCAIITVNEILNAIDKDILSLSANLSRKYWELVKQSILEV